VIKHLTIENFQSHRKTDLDLHPGVNVIVGSSDSGKSAVLRALNWVARNRPIGDSFRSTWGGDTEVSLQMNCDTTIARERTKSKNQYVIHHPADGAQELKAIGQGVPEPVSTLLDLDDINLQAQMDSPFLLSESSAEVARILNRVASLDSIDRAHSNISARVRENQADTRRAETLEMNLTQKIESYDYLPAMEQDLEEAKGASGRLREAETRKTALGDLVKRLPGLQNQLKIASSLLRAGEALGRAETTLKTAKSREADLFRLRAVLEQAERSSARVLEAERILPAGEVLNRCRVAMKQIAPKDDAILHLHLLVGRIRAAEEALETRTGEAEVVQAEYDAARPETCPTCGQPWRRK